MHFILFKNFFLYRNKISNTGNDQNYMYGWINDDTHHGDDNAIQKWR